MKITYLNDKFIPHSEAFVHIEDRGYQFADGVYEVVAFEARTLIDAKEHFERLDRSLQEIRIENPFTIHEWLDLAKELIAKNQFEDGTIYLQVTRGVAERNHAFPSNIKPSILMNVTASKTPAAELFENGAYAVTTREIRWARRDIKSISLLPNILAKQFAKENNVIEAIFVEENGIVTEGSSTNIFMLDENDHLITHPTNNQILAGITRARILFLAEQAGIICHERPFVLYEAYNAKELFISSTTMIAMPITRLNNRVIADGKVGEISKRLLKSYHEYIKATTKTQSIAV